MRKIIRRLFLFLLLCVGIFQWSEPLKYIKKLQDKVTLSKQKQVSHKSSLTYLLSKNNWLEFSAPSFAGKMKFLLTANLASSKLEENEDNANIRYNITYELLDSSDKVLVSKTHHLRTAFLMYQDVNSSTKSKGFYQDTSLYPSVGETLMLRLDDYKHVAKIRLKLLNTDPRISDIGIRSYHLEKLTAYNQTTRWERMSQEKKEYLSRGNVFSIPYLSEDEKNNIVSALWKPNGPLGVKNEDYKERRLYYIEEDEGLHLYKQIEAKWYANAHLKMIRYIKKGKYHLNFTLEDSNSSLITLNHYVKKKLNYINKKEIDAEIQGMDFIIEEDGILEITSTQGVFIEIRSASGEQDFMSEPFVSNDYYHMDENQSIRYTFFSPRKRLIRIECRSESLENSQLHIQMKDKEGTNIQEFHKELEFIASESDYTKGFELQHEASFIYLQLPSNVYSLELKSTKAIKLRLSSRSHKAAYNLYSFSRQEDINNTYLANWFSIRPEGFSDMKSQQRHSSIYKQLSLPQSNVYIQEGNYHYEQLETLQPAASHEILVPRAKGSEFIRSQSHTGIYTRLSSKKTYNLLFKGDKGLKYLKAKLLFQRESKKQTPLRVYVDNVVVIDKTLYAGSGIISLPELDIEKRHDVYIEANDDIEFYMSNTIADNSAYIKRRFVSFNKKLELTFDKTSKEGSIGFQVAHRRKKATPLQFKVKIEGLRENSSKLYETLSFKEYIITADTGAHISHNISYKSQEMSLSDIVYLQLGDNLEAKSYKITVYPPALESTMYLYVNHISLNKKADTRFTKEVL